MSRWRQLRLGLGRLIVLLLNLALALLLIAQLALAAAWYLYDGLPVSPLLLQQLEPAPGVSVSARRVVIDAEGVARVEGLEIVKREGELPLLRFTADKATLRLSPSAGESGGWTLRQLEVQNGSAEVAAALSPTG
ncbi:MAG: hypothetical protein ACFB21_05745, partial [Opitutales bacterium]